jgi:hypothetical protein
MMHLRFVILLQILVLVRVRAQKASPLLLGTL